MQSGNELSSQRPRGRPPSSGDTQRQKMLLVAREQLGRSRNADLNLSQIAQLAGVTPPLAHYYFGNRDGLLAALLAEHATPRIHALNASVREQPDTPIVALNRLMQRLTQLVATDDFLRCCLLLPAAASLRRELRTGLLELIQTAQAASQLRADLPCAYLADALLGLCLAPFLHGDAPEPAGLAATLTLQHAALLQDGILARASHS